MRETKWNFPSDEKLIPVHELPDPFCRPDGSRIAGAEEWPEQREYLKAMLSHYMYGQIPPAPEQVRGEIVSSKRLYEGRAIEDTVRLTFCPGEGKEQLAMHVRVTRPAITGKVPVITWNQGEGGSPCPIEEQLVCDREYAIAEFNREELAPDSRKLFKGPLAAAYPEYDWGAIAMWGWCHSRVIDYLEQTDYADPEKMVATGHSRGGKAALCAAIYDERIALCAANGSGCGGAGCFRYLGSSRGEGTGLCETAKGIAKMFPYWWNPRFRKIKNCECFPFDLPFVRALIAPRAVITTDGLGDTWSNPYGTRLTHQAAGEVFRFLGVEEKNALHMR